jgi:hypothetical protein
MSKAKAVIEAPNIMKASFVGSTLKHDFHVTIGFRKCNYLRSGPPKVSYLVPLAASFSAPLDPLPAITGCRVFICPYYDSLVKEEPSTCDTFNGPNCTFDKIHLQICMYSIISSVFCVKPSQ